MARAIWTGSISFGLVTIPVRLVTAIRENEGLRFHFLDAKDSGRIKNVRTCEIDGKEVPWDRIVRGYEYEKGRYVVVTDEDLEKMRPEATRSIDIREFVDLDQVDPILFDRPYYLEPEKRGRHAYALLREALRRSGKIGIAEVVLRSRQYLAAVKPSGNALVLELMHFASEVVDPGTLDLPLASEKTKDGEMKAAAMLIDAMARPFDPGEFHDTYREELRKMLEARALGGVPAKRAAKAAPATNVVDLVSVLERSLATKKKPARAGRRATAAARALSKGAPWPRRGRRASGGTSERLHR